MKKSLLMTLVLAFFAMFQGYSQTPIVESFEGAWPPTGWTITGFAHNVSRGYDGTKSADCNYSTSDGRIILPAYTATETTTLSFYLGCAYASWASDNVFTVEVSTSVESPSWQTGKLFKIYHIQQMMMISCITKSIYLLMLDKKY